MIIFEYVWISSDEHLARFDAMCRQASIFDKLLGRYKIPDNFPYLESHQGMFLPQKMPTVMIANGIGKIDNHRFSFQSKPFHILGTHASNLLDLDFELEADDLIQVVRAKAESPIMKYYSMPFT